MNGQLHDCFGAQIDMRQVYLTVGGTWGQILAGRELGLFGRQNILTDQTLFGVGATGGQLSGGTTLGRIGFGYIYPQFKAQMTYSTAAGRPFQLSIGVFDPAQQRSVHHDRDPAARGRGRLYHGRHQALGRRLCSRPTEWRPADETRHARTA